ncbi:hypothetical protein PCANC_24363 [Puccinia coronata f. sp. avenae]|uniref:Uncharacterized protein n=1 Tax=Puccinia coronata f. sp. avenae TaxID=200324 RepID=A0A2N5TV98_9BASI|nr:hypothetical protein PCASD_22200 [Puccinia coronata f. sp. avenae]PLW29426.1 hypothetical protein PCANC_24363 [Puccinia coronata f. sp. avenae]PLW41542.1 hypothetical protein PCASD_09975 [Puccinia coronata f. sp. avenae]
MRPSHKQSPFIKKSLHQRLKEQDISIRNSSPQQLQRSLESCRKTLASSGFPETSETGIILRQFESKLLTRLNQISQSSAGSCSPTDATSTLSPPPLNRSANLHQQHENHARSIGPEGIVGFKRRLMQEQSFVPTSDSLLAGMSMSQSIKLQEQNVFRERELATTESLSRLSLQCSSSMNHSMRDEHMQLDAHEAEQTCVRQGEDDEENKDEVILTENDQPDVQRAWELAYQAGFTRGPGDIPQRMLPAD